MNRSTAPNTEINIAVHTGRSEQLKRRRLFERLSNGLIVLPSFVALFLLAFLFLAILIQGWQALDWQFLTSFASRHPQLAGIKAGIFGTLWTTILTVLFSVPLGLGAAIYLEEYAGPGRLNKIIELCISNLAGVPSIVFGLIGLAFFVRWLSLGRSILAAALTLSLLVLPSIIVTSREALRSVPAALKLQAYALGATRLEAIRDHILPQALPGIMTAVILACSRSIGETAPLLMIGAVAYISFVPEGPLDKFTVLPVQIFAWSCRPQPEFMQLAAAAIIVLLVILVSLNAAALVLRERALERRQ